MKVDYEKFPEIPPGCQLNENKKQGLYQVFREGKHRSPGCTKRRESIGTIRKGVFTPSKQWLLTQKLAEINDRETKAEEAAELAKAAASDAVSSVSPAGETACVTSADAAEAGKAAADPTDPRADENPAASEIPVPEEDRALTPESGCAAGDSTASPETPSDAVTPADSIHHDEAGSETEPQAGGAALPAETLADTVPADGAPVSDALEVPAPAGDDDHETAPEGLSPAHLLTALYLQALTGSDGSAEDFVRRRGAMLKEAVPGISLSALTERHAAEVLRFIDPKSFEKTAFRLIRPVLLHAFERTAAESALSLSRDCRGRFMLSIGLSGRSADPALLEGFRVTGCVMTTGAQCVPNRLLESLLADGAGYLIPLTGAHAVKAASQLFNRSRSRPVSDEEAGEASETGETRRSLALLLGTSLNPAFRERWPGVETGTVIRLRTERAAPAFGRAAADDRFFVTTLPLRDDLLGTIAALAAEAAADGAEDRLVIRDVFRDDRLADADPTVTACRLALRASARAMLEENRLTQLGSGAAESMLSLRAQPLRCFDVKDALECLGRALGLC